MYFAKHYNAKCHHRHQDIIYKKQLSDVFLNNMFIQPAIKCVFIHKAGGKTVIWLTS